MDINLIYYIILGITVISYLLGLFLSHYEKKGRISLLSEMGNAGFINIYGVNQPVPDMSVSSQVEENKYCDDEII